MQKYYAVVSAVLLIVLVVARALIMKRAGVKAIRFGEMDKKDFIVIPFAVFYYYMIFASAWGLPVAGVILFRQYYVAWYGAALCGLGVILFISSLIVLGGSFRVGLDEKTPLKLATKGPFGINRNPIYTGMIFIMAGVFLIFGNVVFLIYALAGILLINRQIVLEEKSLKKIFGDEYLEYCKKVRRYF